MGWPSSHEHDQEKRDDAAFIDHEMPPEMKAIFVAPVDSNKKRTNAGKPAQGEGAPPDTRKYVEQLERRVRDLKFELRKAREALAAEKAHVEQLKRRENKSSNLLLQGKLRQLTADYQAEIGQLKKALSAKEQELDETRKLAMKRLFL